jgi:hypothetical protein
VDFVVVVWVFDVNFSWVDAHDWALFVSDSLSQGLYFQHEG